MSEPKPVIIYRLGSLGDTVIALPVFHALARAYPDRERLVLTNFPVSNKAAPLQSVLGESGLVGRSIAYPSYLRSLPEIWNLVSKIRSCGADTLIYLMPTRGLLASIRDWGFFKLCGFKNIVGIPWTASTSQNLADNAGKVERESERLARVFSRFGPIDLRSQSAWNLLLSPSEVEAGAKAVDPLLDRPFITINMGGKAVENDWGMGNWLRLFDILRRVIPQFGIFVVGAEVDSERADTLGGQWGSGYVNACGTLSPREAAAAMSHSALFIGHDSGPLHLASTTGIPVIGLYGDRNLPNKFHPFGEKVHIIHNMAGVTAITVNEAYDLVLRVLNVTPDPIADHRPLGEPNDQ